MKKNGFTLIELIVVIAILGIVITLAVPDVIGYFSKGKEKIMTIKENEVGVAAELFVQDYCLDPINDTIECPITYKINNTDNYLNYICLSNIVNDEYISEIYYENTKCDGFIVFDEYTTGTLKNSQTYLRCGDKYQTEGIENDSYLSMISKCIE